MRLLESARVDDLARALDQVLYGQGAPDDVDDFTERAVQAHLTPQDVASLVRTGLAASARRAALFGLDHRPEEPDDDGYTEPDAEPQPWQLAATEHRNEQADRIKRGEFDD